MSDKPRRFRLNLVNAAEDVPRLVRAYGRACQGEFALVMRPREQRSLLVLVTKEGARVWRSGDPPSNDLVRAEARVKGKRLVVEGGPYDGVSFHPYDADEERAMRKLQGELVEVEFVPDDQFAHLAGPPVATDAPSLPTAPMEEAEAVRLVKAEQKTPGKAGPITLRGRWAGTLTCEGGVPKVELRRKLATYGWLRLESVAGEGWTWRVERTEKWFSEPGTDEGSAPTLLGAIQEGLKEAMGLLSEACGHRDSHRRAAYDTSWAERHPIRPAREGRNPTERLKVKARRGRRRSSSAVPAPTDAAGLRERTAEEARAFEADPKATTAKGWVRAALRALGVEAEKLTGKSRTGDGGREVVVTVVLPGSEDGEEARRRLAEVAPDGLVIGDPGEAASTRSRKKRAPRTKSRSAVEPAVDEAKDKALLDAFSAAIKSALG